MGLEKLTEPLQSFDIDFRVGRITEYKGQVYASLLAYKDARVDMRVLDEAVGCMNWQVKYQRDTKGILQCGISIYDDDKKEWVCKWSNGTESFTEKEKGEYSDAFKRAGFMWGIGRQLYDMPNIRINLNDKEATETNGKYKATGWFKPNNWTWILSEDYSKVKAVDSEGNIRFNNEPYKK